MSQYMEEEYISSGGKRLEDSFFVRHDQELFKAIRQKKAVEHSKHELSLKTGIKDEALLDELVEFGLTTETIAALSLAPLVEVAWADGELDEKERDAILKAVHEEGISEESLAYKLLESWFIPPGPEQQSIERVWVDYVTALCKGLDRDIAHMIREEVIGRARAVAMASGGFLGFGNKISDVEAEIIARFEAVFDKIEG